MKCSLIRVLVSHLPTQGHQYFHEETRTGSCDRNFYLLKSEAASENNKFANSHSLHVISEK